MTAANETTAAAETPLRFRHPIDRLVGTSFKHEHLPAILADGPRRGFFEVHAENYMGAGGPPHRALEIIRRDHPLSLHVVCMSIGGPQPLDQAHLARFRNLVHRYQPALVSEHLAWSTHETTYFNDLLPLPYTKETLARVCDHLDEVQNAIRRPILLENPSTYVSFNESTMSETDFLRSVTRCTASSRFQFLTFSQPEPQADIFGRQQHTTPAHREGPSPASSPACWPRLLGGKRP